jgi:hypothetical protein
VQTRLANTAGLSESINMTQCLNLNLKEYPSLIDLQPLTVRQQPHIEVWVEVACGSGLIPLNSPGRGIETSEEEAILLLLANVMLIQSRLLAIDQVQQTCVVWVRRKSCWRPLRVSWGTGSIDAGVSKDVELVVDALEHIARDARTVAEIDLQSIRLAGSIGLRA